jgi:hypothetical protein
VREPTSAGRRRVTLSGRKHEADDSAGAEVVGALGLIFIERSVLSPGTESFALMPGQAAADALSRARSYDAEHAARSAHDLHNPLHLISSSGQSDARC